MYKGSLLCIKYSLCPDRIEVKRKWVCFKKKVDNGNKWRERMNCVDGIKRELNECMRLKENGGSLFKFRNDAN